MGIFDFEQSGSGSNWNYSNPDKDGYRTKLTGDVIALSDPQKINFSTKQPEFWPDGNPKRNICVTIGSPSTGNELKWTFGPRSGKGPSAAMQAIIDAFTKAGLPGKSIKDLVGKNITVETVAPPQGFSYGQGNPRPFTVTINGPATMPVKGIFEGTELPSAEVPDVMTRPATNMVEEAVQKAYYASTNQQAPQVQQVQQAPIEAGSFYDEDIPF